MLSPRNKYKFKEDEKVDYIYGLVEVHRPKKVSVKDCGNGTTEVKLSEEMVSPIYNILPTCNLLVSRIKNKYVIELMKKIKKAIIYYLDMKQQEQSKVVTTEIPKLQTKTIFDLYKKYEEIIAEIHCIKKMYYIGPYFLIGVYHQGIYAVYELEPNKPFSNQESNLQFDIKGGFEGRGSIKFNERYRHWKKRKMLGYMISSYNSIKKDMFKYFIFYCSHVTIYTIYFCLSFTK